MSGYKITPWSYKQAMALGVEIKPSTSKRHKIDVFKNGEMVARIGAIDYKDYGMYLQSESKQYADERRRLYRIRHKQDASKVGSPAYYAMKILW